MTNAFSSAEKLMPPAAVLRRLAISESGFVFDPTSGNSFTVNDTGLLILRQLQHDADLNAVATTLLNEFDVAPRDLERDLIEFLGMLRDYFGSAS